MRALVLVAVLLAGCAGPGRTADVVLPTVLPPLLPVVHAHEVECLSKSAYERLLVRETRLRNYAEELRVVIETFNREVENE